MLEAELEPDRPVQARRAVTGGMVIAAGSRVAVAITGAGATVAVARLLGPGGSAAFAVAQTLIVVATTLATLGLDHGILYYVSSGAWRASDANRTAQRLSFSLGFVAAGILMLARVAIPSIFHGLSMLATLILALAVPFALSWLYASIVRLGTDDYEGYVLPPAVQSTLALVLVAALAAWHGVLGAVAGLALAHVATSAFAGERRRRREFGSHPGVREPAAETGRQTEGQLRSALRFGLKGYAANAMQYLNLRLDLLLLNGLAASATVGHYAVAVSVTSVMWLLPWALSDILLPRVAALDSASDTEGSLEMVEVKGLRHNTAITGLMTAVLAAALLLLVVPVYGPRFGAATDLGLILLPGVALLALAAPMTATISGRGRPQLILINTLIVTPVTIGLYVGLIPVLGATGAALASTLSYAATFVTTVIMYRRVTGRSLRMMLPTRSELTDYRILARRARLPFAAAP